MITLRSQARASEKIQQWLEGKTVRKVIFFRLNREYRAFLIRFLLMRGAYSAAMEQKDTFEKKAEPKFFNILFPFLLAVLFLWPSWSNWKRADHLADVGIFETTSIVREYTKELVQQSLEGGKGKVRKIDMSVFGYGPEDNRMEGEIPQRRGFRMGDAISVVYDPAEPSSMVAAAKGKSRLSLYLSISGFNLRFVMAIGAGLLVLLGAYNLFHYTITCIMGPQRGRD